MRENEIEVGQHQTARIVGAALKADVPPDTALQHEALLRALAAGNSGRIRRVVTRRVAVVALAAAMVLGTSIVALASDNAVPGDALYGIDRAIERVQLAIARSPEAKAEKGLEIAAERLAEVRVLQAKSAPVRRIAQAAEAAARANAQALDEVKRSSDEERSTQAFAQAGDLLAQLRAVQSSLPHTGGSAVTSLDKELESGAQALEDVRTRRSSRDDGDARTGPGKSRLERSRDKSGSAGISSRRSRRTTPSPQATPAEATAEPTPSVSPSPTPSPSPSPSPSSSPGS